ncbi:DUF736 family protein [Komagataeibacter rhaeticus]|nr:DUF736 family protein [Komagataeibacter rhaeticus]
MTQDIILVPAEFSDAEHAPDYRVHLTDADGPEVGAGWKRTGERAGDYIAVALDDPVFAQPIRANLFRAGDDRAVWVLNWARPSKRAGRGIETMQRAFFLAVGVTAISASGAVDQAWAASVSAPVDTDPYAAVIAEAVQRFDIPATWIRAVMSAESGGEIGAISSKGALGLMQIMPATWSDLRTRYGLGRDPLDVHDNILAGAAFLREMHDRYGSPGFLAAYNAGPGRYEDYRDRQRPLPPETRAYVVGLLPLIGMGGAESLLPVSHPDPLFWTRAPIFAVQSDDGRKGVPVAMKLLPNGVRSDIIAHGLAPVRPLSDGLFVVSSASGAMP